MSEFQFELQIDYPHDHAVNRVWIGTLIGGAIFGIPRLVVHWFYVANVGHPYQMDVEQMFSKLGKPDRLLQGGAVPGYFVLVIVGAAMLFALWRLMLWTVEHRMN